jgi:hypothetical protein
MLLVLCILSQVGGIWVIYSTAIVIHRQNKELRINDTSKWITLVLTKEVYKKAKLESDDELMLSGVMFDIVSASEQDSLITIILVEDSAENKLKDTLSHIQQSNNGWSETAKMAASFGVSIYITPRATALELRSVQAILLEHATFYRACPTNDTVRSIDHPPSLVG